MLRAARLLPLALLLPALVLLPGCLKGKETMTVAQDGSGRASMDMTLDLARYNEMMEMMAGMMGGADAGGPDMEEELDADEIRKELEGKEGVRLVSAETVHNEVEQTMRTTMVVEFDSLEQLFRAGLNKGIKVSLEKDDDGNYVYTHLLGGDEVPEGPEAEQMMQMYVQMLEPFLAGMEMTGRVTFPTKVISTNGTKVDDNTVEWKLAYADLMKSGARRRTVTFSGEGLDWEPFTVTVGAMDEDEPAPVEEPEEEPAVPVTPGEPEGGHGGMPGSGR